MNHAATEERLTSKYLKFTPPEWMERYDWLVGYATWINLGPKKEPPSRFGTAHIRFCTVSPMKKVEVPAERCGISDAGGA